MVPPVSLKPGDEKTHTLNQNICSVVSGGPAGQNSFQSAGHGKNLNFHETCSDKKLFKNN
jgi:hypothetical protein